MFTIDGMEPGRSRLERLELRYASIPNADPGASKIIAQRLADAASDGRVLTYAELGRGISFRLPAINGDNAHVIDVADGIVRSTDKELLDEFLAFLTVQSYKHAKVLANALVVEHRSSEPAKAFIRLASELGIHHGTKRDSEMLFWLHELKKVHAWFKAREHATPSLQDRV